MICDPFRTNCRRHGMSIRCFLIDVSALFQEDNADSISPSNECWRRTRRRRSLPTEARYLVRWGGGSAGKTIVGCTDVELVYAAVVEEQTIIVASSDSPLRERNGSDLPPQPKPTGCNLPTSAFFADIPFALPHGTPTRGHCPRRLPANGASGRLLVIREIVCRRLSSS